MSPPISIPPEYQDRLRFRQPLDNRPDAEILDALTQHNPVTSEKNIWAFWHSGLEGLPGWCKRNLVAWHRLCGSSWTIRLLDTIPGSPNNAQNFVDNTLLPPAFREGTMEGPYIGPHSADLLRGACVWQHGGVWMDVGVILLRDLDRICWTQLADDSDKHEVAVFWVDQVTIANHFIAGRKGNVFLKKWHDLFLSLWQPRRSSDGLIADPLLAFRFEMPRGNYRGFDFPFAVEPKVILEYTAQITAWSRVAQLEEPDGGFNGREYWEKHILKFDVLNECWAAENEIGFVGKDLFDLFATKRTGPGALPESDAYKKAEATVWRLLTRASMQKVTHGKDLLKTASLGTLWDLSENDGKDDDPGTFGELLRYGSVHFEQTRPSIDVVEPEPTGFVIRKGLLEP